MSDPQDTPRRRLKLRALETLVRSGWVPGPRVQRALIAKLMDLLNADATPAPRKIRVARILWRMDLMARRAARAERVRAVIEAIDAKAPRTP